MDSGTSQSWGFMSRSTTKVTLKQVASIVTCGGLTHTEVAVCDKMPNLVTTRPPRTSFGFRGLGWGVLV